MPNLQSSVSRLSPLFEYINKQKEIAKNRQIFELTVTFGLISFFLFFAIRPTLLTISALVGDIKSKELLSSKMTAKINQIITAQDNFATIQEKYYLVEQALPSNPNFVGAYNQINSNSSQNNIDLEKVSFSQSTGNYFSTQISTGSSFVSSLKLIDALFQSRRLIDSPQIIFTKDHLSLPLNIYFAIPQNEKK